MAKDKRFFDKVRIYAKAGDGGDGLASFRREKYVPFGGPDGGDGGDGGSVFLEVSSHISHLESFFYNSLLRAENAQDARKSRRKGKNGKDLILPIPAGTVIHQIIRKNESLANPLKKIEEESSEEITDLTEIGEKFLLAQGGKGGKGNWHFKSATNQAPKEFTFGEKGQERIYTLELRQIADVGLVGFPNAGKSTLLSALSLAKPKIASYPFTTLNPVVGVLNFQNYRRCVIADIPGLIEGAYQNKGLGHQFLRHILRCRLLLFVIDMAGTEGRHPVQDLEALRKEISLYNSQLSAYPWMIVANKMDCPKASKFLNEFRHRFKDIPIFPISAIKKEGISELKENLNQAIFR